MRKHRMLVACSLALGLFCNGAGFSSVVCAAEEVEHRHHHPIEFILKHASQLKLTSDQISKLEALRKHARQNESSSDKPAVTARSQGQTGAHHEGRLREAIERILTGAQLEELKKLHKEAAEHVAKA